MKKLKKCCAFLFSALAFFARADPELATVRVEYFSVPGCEACRTIRREVLPTLEAACSGRYTLAVFDLNEEAHYLRLVEHQERAGRLVNEPVYMAVGRDVLLSGLPEIRTGLVAAVRAARPAAAESAAGGGEAEMDPESGRDRLRARMAGFGAAGVFLAGLADGLNPCAIGSLVFLMGLLAAGRVKGRVLALAGAAFCLASFATYFLLGLGLLVSLRALLAVAALRIWLNRAMAAALLLLAFLSFRDAWRFRRGHAADAVTLKLPAFLQARIRSLARRELRARPAVWAAFALGAAVTLIESVCTGQVYLPTLAWVARESAGRGRALGLLGLYNLGFVLPLAGVFAAALAGRSVFDLLGWQSRHVVRAKIALGVVFLALAAAMAAGG